MKCVEIVYVGNFELFQMLQPPVSLEFVVQRVAADPELSRREGAIVVRPDPWASRWLVPRAACIEITLCTGAKLSLWRAPR